MKLIDIFESNTGAPINKWMHYFNIYEKHLRQFVGSEMTLLEIGTGQGGSSRMWRKYLGDRARVITIDVRDECRQFETDGVSVRIGSQADPSFLDQIIAEFGRIDVVIDDGSHIMDHVNATFDYLFPRIAENAVYLVEDMHAAYWPSFGGGLLKPGTFIENMKTAVDEINSFNPHNPSLCDAEMPRTDRSASIRGISFYPSVVVIEKGPFEPLVERSVPLVPNTTIW